MYSTFKVAFNFMLELPFVRSRLVPETVRWTGGILRSNRWWKAILRKDGADHTRLANQPGVALHLPENLRSRVFAQSPRQTDQHAQIHQRRLYVLPTVPGPHLRAVPQMDSRQIQHPKRTHPPSRIDPGGYKLIWNCTKTLINHAYYELNYQHDSRVNQPQPPYPGYPHKDIHTKKITKPKTFENGILQNFQSYFIT